MRKIGVVLALVVGLVALAPGTAHASHECGLPHERPLWIDFGDGSVPFWQMFAWRGNVVAASNLIYPARIRALGAKTVYFALHLQRRIGSPAAPEDTVTVEENANKLYDYAAASMGCSDPWIALNELFGAGLAPPWSPSFAEYRANVLTFMRVLGERGARPFLNVSTAPYTAGEARDWWLQVSRYGDIVREVYFEAPQIHRAGPVLASRKIRRAFRQGIQDFLDVGVPAEKLGLSIGFQTGLGTGGREGLQPPRAWFRTIKWQVLAARQVGNELRFGSIWSWGWAVWGERGKDPDKPAAACVYLWARNPKLCNGPAAAGDGFNASRSEGQLDLPRGARCLVGGRPVRLREIDRLRAVTDDEDLSFSAAFARAVGRGWARIEPADALAAERRIVIARFDGSRDAYRAALARSRASAAAARGVIEDELRRLALERRFRVATPSAADVRDYYETYAEALAREVQVRPAAPWLGGRVRGLALAPTAPDRVFTVPVGRWRTIVAPQGRYRVRARARAKPLRAVSPTAAERSIRAALSAAARRDEFARQSVKRQIQAQQLATCRRDDLPTVDAVDLTDYLPFLALS